MTADARWDTCWSVARSGGRIVGAVTTHRPTTARFSGGPYDLRRLAGSLGQQVPDDPRHWAFVGGCRDLAAGTVTAGDLNEAETDQVRRVVAAHAFAEAHAAGAFPVALHVREPEVSSFVAGLGARASALAIDETADLRLAGDDVEQHLASLGSSQRERCRRDQRRFAALGCSTARVPAASVLAEAAPLVWAVKEKYGVVDHPRLCLFRLQEWARAVGEDACYASLVRDPAGRLIAVSFFAVEGEVLEGYEIGLADDVPGREFAYLQAMIHGPVRYAFELGCRSIDLGLSSSTVKRRRGAVITRTWLVSLASGGGACPAPEAGFAS
ncbi:GNAT family N-acetyltransferase [Micromonospora sp. KLBMP9576]|uniref:GNAT family N-acetyltransferase n=1 Tax=Micromonospora sp. KLBMP9576 TaxID=3424769 RepID=UPI003D8A8768